MGLYYNAFEGVLGLCTRVNCANVTHKGFQTDRKGNSYFSSNSKYLHQHVQTFCKTT